ADVTDRVAVDAAAREAELALGSVDLLVNNAGLVDAEVPLWQADPEQFAQVLTTNVYGPFLLARALVPGMLSRGGGRVIDLSSGAGTHDSDVMAAYNITKTALFRISGEIGRASCRERG